MEALELTRELTAIVSKVAQLEPEIQRSAIDAAKAVKAGEAQSKEIVLLQGVVETLTKQLEEAQQLIKDQSLKDVAHEEAIDKLFRLVTENQKRLDGDSITNISYANYETVRETIKIISDKLTPKNSVSYDEIVSSFTNTRFLGQALKWTLGLFGTSAVIAGIATVTGVGGDGRITAQKLSGDVNDLRKDVAATQKSIDTTTKTFDTFKENDFKDLKNTATGDISSLRKQIFDLAIKK